LHLSPTGKLHIGHIHIRKPLLNCIPPRLINGKQSMWIIKISGFDLVAIFIYEPDNRTPNGTAIFALNPWHYLAFVCRRITVVQKYHAILIQCFVGIDNIFLHLFRFVVAIDEYEVEFIYIVMEEIIRRRLVKD